MMDVGGSGDMVVVVGGETLSWSLSVVALFTWEKIKVGDQLPLFRPGSALTASAVVVVVVAFGACFFRDVTFTYNVTSIPSNNAEGGGRRRWIQIVPRVDVFFFFLLVVVVVHGKVIVVGRGQSSL